MASNLTTQTTTPSTLPPSTTIATDQLASGEQVQLVKIMNATAAGTERLIILSSGAMKTDASATTQPVSGTFFQATQPVSNATLPLPTGAATETSLGTDGATPPTIPGTGIRGWLRSIYDTLRGTLTVGGSVSVSNLPATQPVSGTVTVGALPALPTGANAIGSVSVSNLPATQAVSATTLPLPTGAATSANQATAQTSLGSIDTKTPALGQALAAGSVPVILPLATITTLTPPTSVGVNNFPASQTVAGTVAVSNQPTAIGVNNFPATQPVSIATMPSTPVTGTFFLATQPVSATTLPLPTGASTETTLVAQSAKLPATIGQKAMVASLAIAIASDQSAVPVSGTFFQATQPVSATALPLPAGAATEASFGTDITTPTAMPTGGAGVRGWLSAIWTKLNGSLAVTGTFWQVTQPVSGTVALSGTVNVTSGATIALTTPQAALTASTDTSYTFASQAKHMLIQNKSATNVYIEFDATTTVGSLLVYPNGQLLFFDIPVTAMHLYSTAATNVNGTADNNIVLKGWA